jgi:hypothetical protein
MGTHGLSLFQEVGHVSSTEDFQHTDFKRSGLPWRRYLAIERGYYSNGILKVVNFIYNLPSLLTRYIIEIMSIYTYHH